MVPYDANPMNMVYKLTQVLIYAYLCCCAWLLTSELVSLQGNNHCAISCKFAKFTRFLKFRVRGNSLMSYTLMDHTTHAYYIVLDREVNEEHFDV
jgi:hypothetical protein